MLQMPSEGERLLRAGNGLVEAGRAAEAETAFRDAARLLDATPGPDLASALNNLATCLAERGELERALPVIRRAVQVAAAALPPESRAQVAGNLAQVLIRLGESEAARPYAEEAIHLAEDARSPYVAVALLYRIEIQIARRDWRKAHADLDRTFECLNENHPERAPLRTIAHGLRAAAWQAAGDHKAALREFEIAVTLGEQLPGWNDSPEKQRMLSQYAQSMRKTGNKRGAEEIVRKLRVRN
jgi:tetratricopeptide (TPR) repeat protein